MSGWRNSRWRSIVLNGRTIRPVGSWLLACALLVVGCAKRDEAARTSPQVLRLSQRNEPSDLDPATATLPDEFFIIRALSEGLVLPEPSGGQRPATAERWEVSADGLTYTFHLRQDARWSNGDAVTAADFVESYRRVLAPATAAPKASLFFAVKNARAFVTGEIADFSQVGLRAADAHTLIITLEQPTPGFLAYVASGTWIPVHPRVVAQHGRAWTKPENFVGNGPFTLSEWRANQRIVVKKNPGYFAAARVRLDKIQFIAFDNGDTEERAYRAGQIDVTMAVPASKLDTYARDRPEELRRTPLAETRYVAFNTQRPPFGDVRVRRALTLALDREALVASVLRGGQKPAYRFVPQALRAPNDHANSLEGEARGNPAEARRLLAGAGFSDGKNFPRLELASWGTTPVLLEAIQAMWKQELGVDIALVRREARVHLAMLAAGDFDLALVNTLADVVDARNILEDFGTEAPGNYPRWSDARYDALLREASHARDATQAAALLRQAETRLLEEAVIAPIYFNAKNWLMRPHVQGWQEDALWTRFYHDVYLEER